MITDQLEMKTDSFIDTDPDDEIISSTDICGALDGVTITDNQTSNKEGVSYMSHSMYPPNYGVISLNPPLHPFGQQFTPPINMSSIQTPIEDVVKKDYHLREALERLDGHINTFYLMANQMNDRQQATEIIKAIEKCSALAEMYILRAEERIQWQQRMNALSLPANVDCDLRLYKSAYGIVRIFSRDKKEYWAYNPFSKRIYSVPTIVPTDPPFPELAKDAHLACDRLEKEDAFSFLFIYCGGSDSIPSVDKPNPVYIRPSINISSKVLGDNVQIFMDTGMAYFASREDAQKCMDESGDNIRQYVNNLMKKEQAKSEVTGLKTAVRDTIIATVAGLVTLAGREIIGNLTKKGGLI